MIQLNFHQTFPPTLVYIGRILELAIRSKQRPMTKEEISAETGIPTGKNTGKVVPHLYYGFLMGLLEELPRAKNGSYILQATELGMRLYREDPALRESVSQLLCHIRLTSPQSGAPLWATMMRSILPAYSSGIEECILDDELKKRFSTAVRTGPVYSTYQTSFDAFCLLEVRGHAEKRQTRLLSLPYQREQIFAYGYCLLYEWEQRFANRTEISAEEVKVLCFGHTFGWSAQREFEMLEQLVECGLIHLNRQLHPFTVMRKNSAREVGEKLYRLLL